MTTYLSLSGAANNYLTLPSTLSITEIDIDGRVDGQQTYNQYILHGNSHVSRLNANSTSSFFNSGASITNFTCGTRSVFKLSWGTAGTDTWKIFDTTAGEIYDIKVYNGATLLAHYDMSTGNVNDQTGNGYNATLTGGTWLNDGAGTGTTYTGTGTALGSENVTSADIVIQSTNGVSQSLSSLNTVEHDILALNGLSIGISSLFSSEHVIQSPLETVIGMASLTSGETFITVATYLGEGVSTGQSILLTNETVILIPPKAVIGTVTLNGHSTTAIVLKGHSSPIIQLNGNVASIIQLKGGKI